MSKLLDYTGLQYYHGKVEGKISQLRQEVFDPAFKNGYYVSNTTKPSFVASDTYRCLLVSVAEGEVFSVLGRGTSSARFWFVCDKYLNIVRSAAADSQSGATPVDITIGSGECYLGYNTYNSYQYKKVELKNTMIDRTDILFNKCSVLDTSVNGVQEMRPYTVTGNTSVNADYSLFASAGKVIVKATYDTTKVTRLRLVANDSGGTSHPLNLSNNVEYEFEVYGYNVIINPTFASGISSLDVSLYVRAASLNERLVAVENVVPQISSIKQEIGYHNNMVSDGLVGLPSDIQITLNGTQSLNNYGKENAIYQMTLPKADKYRIFFRFRFTKAIPYVNNSTYMPLLQFGWNGTRYMINPSVWPRALVNKGGGYLVPPYLVGLNNYNYATATAEFNGFNFKPIKGEFAFTCRYTGDISQEANRDIVAVISSSSIVFKHSTNDSVISTVSFSADDTIDEVVDAINALTDFEATGISVAGHTCADLLVNSSLSVQMVITYTNSNSQTVYDSTPVYVSYAHDTSWHTAEMLVDMVNLKAYYNFDGYTTSQSFQTFDTYRLALGYNYNSQGGFLKIEDLEIDVNNYGDAEVVEYKSDPQTPSSEMREQLISKHNPRLLIFEGHGVNDCMDVDAPTDAEGLMAASTDRLYLLFDTLKAKGYLPVSLKDVVEWKINGKELPKRCYTMMFDDFRIENYMVYGKRKPFEKYNAKPGLAIITGERTRAEEITIGTDTYTLGQIFNDIILAGWYPCSHTSDHRYINKDAYSEEPGKMENDVIECNKLGIYSDVLVYPYGAMDISRVAAAMNSCFKIGIYITSKNINTRASGDFFLTRYEIGTRVTTEQMLMPIV